MNKYDIQKALREEVIEFTFRKVNGDERVMTGTLNSGYIPKDMLPVVDATANPVKENDSVVRCFDTGIQQWRSFRVDSLTKFDGKVVSTNKTPE